MKAALIVFKKNIRTTTLLFDLISPHIAVSFIEQRKANIECGFNFCRYLDQIRIPVLLINSRNDKTVPPSHAENYRREIPSNHFELVTLENSGHVITEDIEREIVFTAALNFIRKYSKQ